MKKEQYYKIRGICSYIKKYEMRFQDGDVEVKNAISVIHCLFNLRVARLIECEEMNIILIIQYECFASSLKRNKVKDFDNKLVEVYGYENSASKDICALENSCSLYTEKIDLI